MPRGRRRARHRRAGRALRGGPAAGAGQLRGRPREVSSRCTCLDQ